MVIFWAVIFIDSYSSLVFVFITYNIYFLFMLNIFLINLLDLLAISLYFYNIKNITY